MRPACWKGSPFSSPASLHATGESRTLPDSPNCTAGLHVWNLLANILPSFKHLLPMPHSLLLLLLPFCRHCNQLVILWAKAVRTFVPSNRSFRRIVHSIESFVPPESNRSIGSIHIYQTRFWYYCISWIQNSSYLSRASIALSVASPRSRLSTFLAYSSQSRSIPWSFDPCFPNSGLITTVPFPF